jgi:hypothetical protein
MKDMKCETRVPHDFIIMESDWTKKSWRKSHADRNVGEEVTMLINNTQEEERLGGVL